VALNSSRTMAPKGNRAKLKNQAGDKVRGDKKLPVASKGTTSLKADKGKGLKKSAKAKSPVAISAVAVTLPTLKHNTVKGELKSEHKNDHKTDHKSDKKVAVKAHKADAKVVAPARRRRAEPVASDLAAAMFAEMHAGEASSLARQAARSQRERDLLARLATSMNRSDEMPNLEVAADIVFSDDVDSVSMLVSVIERHDTVHAPDAARVLCEVGIRAPHLLEPSSDRLLALCDESQKEVLAYTMYAMSPLAHRYAEHLWDLRDLFWASLADLQTPANMAQAGAVKLLAALCAAGPDYARTLAGGLVDLLGKCMPKDVAFFAESVLPALGTAHSHRAKPVLDRRMKELTPAEVARLRRAVRAAQTGQPLFAAA
jgi:hypothetical protein